MPLRSHRDPRGTGESALPRRKLAARVARGFSGCARAALALAAVVLAGCGAQEEPARAIALGECRLPRLSTAARCGTLQAPEDRASPRGRTIELFVAVLPANTLTPLPDPLFLIAGGPGQAASQLGPFAARLSEVRRTRDVVLVDQRGTGRSSPLTCEALAPDDDLERALESDPVAKATDCIRELREQGVDTTQYTTDAWVSDLEAVRAAMGYPRINLWGGSYGTRVALEYMRRHPDRVRTAILDGVAPPSMNITLDVWSSRDRALDAVIAACAETASCRSRHPDLPGALRALVEGLAGGRRVEIADPRTGRTRTLTMTAEGALSALHLLTYSPESAALIPEVIGRAAGGDFGPMLAVSQSVSGDLAAQLNAPLHYSVTCTEDAPRASAQARKAITGTRSGSVAERILAVCDRWPRGKPIEGATAPVRTGIPVLVISGALDPVTPAENGEAVAKMLGNARHVVARGYGHVVSPHACAPRLIGEFVRDAGFDGLSRACIEHFEQSARPFLWPDRMGPQP